MTLGANEHLRLQQATWFCVMAAGALALGYFLVVSPYLLVLGVLCLGWLLLLPYHTQLAARLAVATFGSSFIVPFFPGRPYLWEFAALLAWSGMMVTFSFHQYMPDFWGTIKRNKWLFFGSIGYCAVLVVTMCYRGFGLRILGTDQIGGRFYFQQLSCAIFPLLFVACRLSERTLTKLFLLQCLLTGTYLISDFVFSLAPRDLWWLLQFFELPGDAVNFEMQSERFGLRRFQSLAIVGQGLTFAVLLRYRLREFFSIKAFYLLPLLLAILTVSLLSGHRWVIVIICPTLVFCAYSQRLMTIKNAAIIVVLTIVGLIFVYSFALKLPRTLQRSLLVLPGIKVDRQAFVDGAGTLETRRLLRQAGWKMIPQYLWIGRGFGQSSVRDYSPSWDMTWVTWHVNQGKFYNAPIGLMVNTGLFGTVFMFLFLMAGSVVAIRIIRHLRRWGCDDAFSRMCSVVASLWFANTVAFVFVGGDAEFAMKTFSLQAGILLVCDHHLRKRIQSVSRSS